MKFYVISLKINQLSIKILYESFSCEYLFSGMIESSISTNIYTHIKMSAK